MELFWILFGLGYGAYRNVKDQLPIKKTDATITHTTFQTWFVILVWFSIGFLGGILEMLCEIAAVLIDDYLDGIWSTFFGIVGIITGVAAVGWFLVGALITAKWARQVEERLTELSAKSAEMRLKAIEYRDNIYMFGAIAFVVLFIVLIFLGVYSNQLTQ